MALSVVYEGAKVSVSSSHSDVANQASSGMMDTESLGLNRGCSGIHDTSLSVSG